MSEDLEKLRRLARDVECITSDKSDPEFKQFAAKEGVRLAGDEESKGADYRLCPKLDLGKMYECDTDLGNCSVCKCHVVWTPGVPGPTLLICIDCALKESGEATTEE